MVTKSSISFVAIQNTWDSFKIFDKVIRDLKLYIR